MKTKIIFLAATLVCINLKAQMSVDNPVMYVDNQYHHQLSCLASTETENFSVLVQWKSLHGHHSDGRAPYLKQSFVYEVKNLNTLQQWKGSYSQFFSENTQITNNEKFLNFSGDFFMYKRLGTIAHSADILFIKDGGQYLLDNLKITAKETFTNPKNFCSPPTRLCGSLPSEEPATVLIESKFVTSSCHYKNL